LFDRPKPTVGCSANGRRRGGGEEEEEEVCGRTDVKFVEVCLHHPDMCTEKFTIYKL